MKDIIRILNSLEACYSGLLFKEVSETNQYETKEQRGRFLSMLLGTLDTSLLGNVLAGKGVISKRQNRGINRAGEGVIRAGYENKRQDVKTKWIFNAVSSFN